MTFSDCLVIDLETNNMENNLHSTKIAKILMNFAGIKFLSWNLHDWRILNEFTVQFSISKKGFYGCVSVTQTNQEDIFALMKCEFGKEPLQVVEFISQVDLVKYIENLGKIDLSKGSRAPMMGERAPSDQQIFMGRSMQS